MSRKWSRPRCELSDRQIREVASMSDEDVAARWPVVPFGHAVRDVARQLNVLRRRLREAERNRDHSARREALRLEYSLLDPFGERWGPRRDGMDPADYIAHFVARGVTTNKISMHT